MISVRQLKEILDKLDPDWMLEVDDKYASVFVYNSVVEGYRSTNCAGKFNFEGEYEIMGKL